MSHDEDDADRRLDRHIEAFREQPVPDGPSSETLAATLVRLTAADAGTAMPKKWVHMTFVRRIAGAATFAAAACLLIFLFAFHGPLGATVAYADVIDKLAGAHSVAYTTSVEMPGVEGLPTMSTRTIVADGGRMRMEMLGGVVTIRDGATMVSLDASAKTMTVIETVGATMPAARPAAMPTPADLVAGLKTLSGGKVEPLGERTIGGVVATGFRAPWQSNGTLTIWADKTTAAPLRIKMTMQIAGRATTAVLDHFEIDPPIDDATFSTALPAGYAKVTQKLDITNAVTGKAAEAVAAVLKSYAAASDGAFPANLTDWAALMKVDAKHQPAVDPQAIGVMSGQLFSMPGGYVYAGAGVRLGEADKIVFRYRPTNATRDRALFGDLRIADVDAATTTKP